MFFVRFEATNTILDTGSGHGWLLRHLCKNEFAIFSNWIFFRPRRFDLCRKSIDYRHQRTTGSPIETAHGWNSVSMQKNARRVGFFLRQKILKNSFSHTHSSWRSWVLPASRMMFGALQIRKTSKIPFKSRLILDFPSKMHGFPCQNFAYWNRSQPTRLLK